MNLTKRQVGALLSVISKDDARPILCHAKIDTFEGKPVLVATDSYHMAVLKLTDDILPAMGHVIPRDELTKWYKLASMKDTLSEAELLTMGRPDDQAMFAKDKKDKSEYPKWQKILEGHAPEAITAITFNSDYVATMQLLSGVTGLRWTFHGPNAPLISHLNDDLYIVMPLKG